MLSAVLELGFYIVVSAIGVGLVVYTAWKENRLNW